MRVWKGSISCIMIIHGARAFTPPVPRRQDAFDRMVGLLAKDGPKSRGEVGGTGAVLPGETVYRRGTTGYRPLCFRNRIKSPFAHRTLLFPLPLYCIHGNICTLQGAVSFLLHPEVGRSQTSREGGRLIDPGCCDTIFLLVREIGLLFGRPS